MTQVEKKVQDCDKTFEYEFEFSVRVKFETQGIRIPENQIDNFQESMASRMEEGLYSDIELNKEGQKILKDMNYSDLINHECYEINGKGREELMEDLEFFKTHTKHSSDIGEVDITSYDWWMEEWE